MKHVIRFTMLGLMVLLFSANTSFATKLYDYGDAVGYGDARNKTDEWQWLGDSWDKEKGTKDDDGSDDGVFWSTDGGTSWGHDVITAGQEVTFRFDVHRAAYGRHAYDQLRVWIDWNQDQVFEHDPNKDAFGEDEELLGLKWMKNTAEDGNTRFADDKWNASLNPDAVLFKQFYATTIVPEDVVGTTWLRARVTCWDTPYDQTNPYISLYQGETEDWKLTVQAVPEPGTFLLLGAGLFGLVSLSRKRGKK